MRQAKFPTRRADGSVSVAGRFNFGGQVAADAAAAKVRSWIAEREAETIELTEDLASAPYIVVRDDSTFDVVFEGRPGQPRWKDWMVALTRELASTVSNVRFDCFYDLVGDVRHPGSGIPGSGTLPQA